MNVRCLQLRRWFVESQHESTLSQTSFSFCRQSRVFVFVWWYCKKRGHAKWTWTLIVMFSPNILLIPPMLIYGAYAFRVYIYRFIKSIIADFKVYDYEKDMKEVKEYESEQDHLREEREQKQQEEKKAKAEAKEAKEREKEEEKEE